jgi:asparagine synthase (glutamine-hydrolysing)
MACSLEVRNPFLDKDVVEFAASLPVEWKIKGFNLKRILKDAFAESLPENILKRKKMGFGIPVSQWLRKEFYEDAKNVLGSENARAHSFFNTENVLKLLDAHRAGKVDASYQLTAILCFEIWFDEYSKGNC